MPVTYVYTNPCMAEPCKQFHFVDHMHMYTHLQEVKDKEASDQAATAAPPQHNEYANVPG